MVIRLLAVLDSLLLHELDAVFCAVLNWDHVGFLFRVHGQEFNSFRRATRSRTLREFQLRPTETFLYTCGAIDLWEWEIRLVNEDPGGCGRRCAAMPGRSRRRTAATLRWSHRLPADAETPKDGRGDVHPGADGGCAGNVGRLRSRGAARDLALLSPDSAGRFRKHRSTGCKSTACWSRSASVWKKPINAWPGARI